MTKRARRTRETGVQMFERDLQDGVFSGTANAPHRPYLYISPNGDPDVDINDRWYGSAASWEGYVEALDAAVLSKRLVLRQQERAHDTEQSVMKAKEMTLDAGSHGECIANLRSALSDLKVEMDCGVERAAARAAISKILNTYYMLTTAKPKGTLLELTDTAAE